jgi:hypothetical protein
MKAKVPKKKIGQQIIPKKIDFPWLIPRIPIFTTGISYIDNLKIIEESYPCARDKAHSLR